MPQRSVALYTMPTSLSRAIHRVLNATTISNENKFLQSRSKVLALPTSPDPEEPQSPGLDGITGCANAFVQMGPVLAEPLIPPVDCQHLQAPALGFIQFKGKRNGTWLRHLNNGKLSSGNQGYVELVPGRVFKTRGEQQRGSTMRG